MKKFLSILLIFSLVLSTLLFSCEDKDKSKDKTDKEQEQEQTDDDKLEKEKAILDSVIFLMEDDTYDTDNVVSKFFGDFVLDGFGSASEPISKIYKVDDFLVVEYKDGDVVYQTVKDSCLYTVQRSAKTNELLVDEEEYPYDCPLSIFGAFGIDMSMVYSTEDVELTEEFPVATYDSLTVSEDQKSVTFSEDYLKQLARSLVSSFEPEDGEMQKFLSGMSASGVFSVLDQSIKFTIEGTLESFGDITCEVTMSFRDKKPYSVKGVVSLTTESEGIPMIITQENEIHNMIYDRNDELISLRVINRSTEEYQYNYDGVAVDYSSSFVENYLFTLENAAAKEFQGFIDINETISASGQTQKATASVQLILGTASMSYSSIVNGEEEDRIEADHVSLQTPENVTIPEDVYNVLPK